jgi:hypothetical protein
MIKIWEWLDGKKLNIGAAMLWLAGFITAVIYPHIGQPPPEWLQIIYDGLVYTGGVLVPTGLGHKWVKNVRAKRAEMFGAETELAETK